jgi:hypothetical protein
MVVMIAIRNDYDHGSDKTGDAHARLIMDGNPRNRQAIYPYNTFLIVAVVHRLPSSYTTLVFD